MSSAEEPFERARSDNPWGWIAGGASDMRSTTLTKRTREVGREAAQQLGGRERLHRGDVAGAGHDDVGLAVADRARPLPLGGPARAVLARGGHVEVLQLRLLVETIRFT